MIHNTKIQKISPIKQRILQFVDSLKISKRDFYAKTSISRGTLESETGITEDTVAKFLAIYPEINLTWLITGKGEMSGVKEPVTTSTAASSSAHIYKELYLEKEKEIRELNREIGEMRAELAYLKNEVLAYERACLQKPVAEPELELKE